MIFHQELHVFGAVARFSHRKLPISAREKKSMSYAVGYRQFPIRDFRRAIFDGNPGGNGSKIRQDFHRKLFEPDCSAQYSITF